MAFPKGTITLSEITDAYSVPANMNALRGKDYYSPITTSSVYTKNYQKYTIPSSGEFDIDRFRGGDYKYSDLKFSRKEAVDEGKGGLIVYVRGYCGIAETSEYRIIGDNTLELKLDFFRKAYGDNGGQNAGTNSSLAKVMVDGVMVYQNDSTNLEGTFGPQTLYVKGTTIQIQVECNASVSGGESCHPSGTWNYKIEDEVFIEPGYINGVYYPILLKTRKVLIET